MIETQFYILEEKDHAQYSIEAQELGISIDYYLSEFCDVRGEWVIVAD
jgi:hypothetical protein